MTGNTYLNSRAMVSLLSRGSRRRGTMWRATRGRFGGYGGTVRGGTVVRCGGYGATVRRVRWHGTGVRLVRDRGCSGTVRGVRWYGTHRPHVPLQRTHRTPALYPSHPPHRTHRTPRTVPIAPPHRTKKTQPISKKNTTSFAKNTTNFAKNTTSFGVRTPRTVPPYHRTPAHRTTVPLRTVPPYPPYRTHFIRLPYPYQQGSQSMALEFR